MKKVISFCLWGNEAKYVTGAIRNIELAKQIYPDWEVWLYCGTSVSNDLYRKIGHIEHHEDVADSTTLYYSDNIQVVILDKEGDWTMMLDRLRPSLEKDVECFISRDTDSRLSVREKLAVNEWLESDKIWHTMHCHAWHSVPMLGGMFGCKKTGFDNLWTLANNWQNSTRSR
jgi:hypothetical protein